MAGTTPLVATALAAGPLGVTGVGLYLSIAALVSGATMALSEIVAPLDTGEERMLGGASTDVALPQLEAFDMLSTIGAGELSAAGPAASPRASERLP